MASHRQILANHRSARRTHLGDERGALRPDRVLADIDRMQHRVDLKQVSQIDRELVVKEVAGQAQVCERGVVDECLEEKFNRAWL